MLPERAYRERSLQRASWAPCSTAVLPQIVVIEAGRVEGYRVIPCADLRMGPRLGRNLHNRKAQVPIIIHTSNRNLPGFTTNYKRQVKRPAKLAVLPQGNAKWARAAVEVRYEI